MWDMRNTSAQIGRVAVDTCRIVTVKDGSPFFERVGAEVDTVVASGTLSARFIVTVVESCRRGTSFVFLVSHLKMRSSSVLYRSWRGKVLGRLVDMLGG